MRSFVIVLAALVFVAGDTTADEYHDARAGFRVTIPGGWMKTPKEMEGETLSLDSPRLEQTMGTCSVHAHLLPGTESVGQDAIDKQLSGRFTPAYWLQAFKGTGMDDVVVETSGEEIQRECNTYFVVANYDETGTRIKFKAVMHVVPGHSYNVFCGALAAGYAQEEADFEIILDSFTPVPADLVVERTPLPAPAYLSHPATLQSVQMAARVAARERKAAVQSARASSRCKRNPACANR